MNDAATRCAALHARAFAGHSRPWSAAEIEDLLASPFVFLVEHGASFALGRAIVGEAELLTIATDPAAQRQGLARACLAAFEQRAAELDVRTVFLEVAEDNAHARTLYLSAGYVETGRRPGYYARPNRAVDAVLMSKALP